MTRYEVKKILKTRNEMKEICEQMKDDVSIEVETESLINIYDKSISSLEDSIEKIDILLLAYCEASPVGVWLLKIKGMTLDIAAGLLAYYDVKNKECAAQFIQYAGVGNTSQAHNSEVRKILDRLNVNFQKDENSYYANLRHKKYKEWLQNKDVDKAKASLKADRYVLKLFVSHLFEEMFREEHNGMLPKRNYDSESVLIEPEVPYTR